MILHEIMVQEILCKMMKENGLFYVYKDKKPNLNDLYDIIRMHL